MIKKSQHTIIQVACGFGHSGILYDNGYCQFFGDNSDAQSDFTNQTTDLITYISCGARHSGVIYSNKSIRLFGSNANGQCN